jgi:hypothetical protein
MSGAAAVRRALVRLGNQPVLALALLLLAVAEIGWIGALLVVQESRVDAVHVHLATTGMGIACSGAAAAAAVGALRRTGWAAPLAIACAAAAAFTAVAVLIAVPGASWPLAALGLAGALVAAAAGASILAGASHPAVRRGAAVALAAFAVLIAVEAVLAVALRGDAVALHRVRAAVVLLDALQVLSLATAGLALRGGRMAAALCAGSAGAALFLTDLWLNVVLVPGGRPLHEALLFALVGEIPAAALCARAALLGVRGMSRRAEVGLADARGAW